jgi:hypothetical protein
MSVTQGSAADVGIVIQTMSDDSLRNVFSPRANSRMQIAATPVLTIKLTHTIPATGRYSDGVAGAFTGALWAFRCKVARMVAVDVVRRWEWVESVGTPVAPVAHARGNTVCLPLLVRTSVLDTAEEHLHYLWDTPHSLWGWLTTVDHKKIGWRYIVTALASLAIGGIEALILRVQLAQPDQHLLSPEAYNQIFTMQGDDDLLVRPANPGRLRQLPRPPLALDDRRGAMGRCRPS